VGEENALTIRVYGSKGGLKWEQEHPNWLTLMSQDQPDRILKRGNGYLSPATQYNTRLPAGHPEAFLEAFANTYRAIGRTIAAQLCGEDPDPLDLDFPTVQDGARGINFIHAAVRSDKTRSWVDARYTPPGS